MWKETKRFSPYNLVKKGLQGNSELANILKGYVQETQ